MAEMTIQLRCDPQTGKKDIVITLHSDADSLPLEHEQQHRALVDRLLEGGMIKAGELGQIVVQRKEKDGSVAPVPESQPESERRGLAQDT